MDSRKGGLGDDGGKHTGFISHHEEEWGLVGYGVRAVIVGELREGDVLSPRSGVGAAEDSQIGLYFLVYTFGFPISLRVVSSGEGEFITEEFAQFPSKGGGELRSSIGDDFVIKTESFEDF